MGSTMILCNDYRCVANILLHFYFHIFLKMICNVQIFTWIGINPAPVRNAVISEFLSGGFEGLRDT